MTEYKGRGIHNPKLLISLKEGRLSELLNVVNGIDDLDVQLRSDYVNIYYKGGRIIKINSESSAEFDEKYFLLKKVPFSQSEVKKRKLLLQKFKKHNYKSYFDEAMNVMDSWFKENHNPERNEQHLLAKENKSGDYTVIDIEFQVSILSSFACIGQKKSPRFDIIAVNKRGELCVIELKKGAGALDGKSGLKDHWESYKDSIGRNPQQFVEELKLVLKQKQEFGLIDKSVEITKHEPIFMFAYAYKSETDEYEKFMKIYDTIGHPIPRIFLKDGAFKLSDL